GDSATGSLTARHLLKVQTSCIVFRMSKFKDRGGGYLTTLTAGVICQALTFINGMLTARALGEVGRGELGAVLLWPSLFTIVGELGLPDAAAYGASRRDAPLRGLWRAALAAGLVQAAAACTVLFFALPFLLGENGAHLVPWARIYGLYLLANFPILNVMGALKGAGYLRGYNLIPVVRAFLYAASVASLWAFGAAGVGSVTAAYTASYFVVFVVAVAVSGISIGRQGDLGPLPLGELGHYGIRSYLGRVISMLGQQADTVAGAWLLGAAAYGQYLVARAIPAGVMLVGEAVAVAAFPAVARDRDEGAGFGNATRYVRLALAGCSACAVALAAMAPWAVTVIFGNRFAAAGPVCQVLCAAALPAAVAAVVSAELRALGRPGAASAAECSGMIC
ncbi:MAG: oligosaccharide flippase family protein, partial [Anaerolineae bacterium]|nr:oligosaccharide flippase family protein [Anaerolineae bacterium]